MIKYALVCDQGHDFESWFPDSASYDTQAKRGLIACPECDSIRVAKAIMAPSIAASRGQPAAPVALLDERGLRMREIARRLRTEIIANTDDVGAKFPEEARAIHDGEAPARSIRGQATLEQARALIEDGVGVLPLPFLPDERN
ncbi:MAG: DUF1178 family protein [Roseiarcus sp.]|jgi:hypothetical protein